MSSEKKKFDPIILTEPDGFIIPEVRSWSIEKYKLVGGYCDIFTTGMRRKWDQLVYIDLFAGAGYAKIKETGKTYFSSSLIAMSLPNPFSKYMLCEADKEKCAALKNRVKMHFPYLNVVIINGDSNQIIDAVKAEFPSFGKGNTLLSFCFVDPFSLNLNFRTIETLGKESLVDFLILQALHMDGNRNLGKYIKEENDKISNYLGNPNWREEFDRECRGNISNFVKFLADQYVLKMKGLSYIPEANMHPIRSNIKNLPLYYLAFFSKHSTGIDFYKKVNRYCNPQFKLDL